MLEIFVALKKYIFKIRTFIKVYDVRQQHFRRNKHFQKIKLQSKFQAFWIIITKVTKSTYFSLGCLWLKYCYNTLYFDCFYILFYINFIFKSVELRFTMTVATVF